MSRSSMMRSAMAILAPVVSSGLVPAVLPAGLAPSRQFGRSAQRLLGELGDDLVILRRDEAGASVDIHRRQAQHHLLAKAEDRQIALQKRLLIGRQLHP